ncbi:hypothetical protein CBM2634_A240091 [Cupriavidus taiwanensis]|uniref:Uncharacterized protein n=1 Tax=Cupriavidus taiwanensis TaxID=164546 RepID=A0A375J0J9_9BURK|nr:hypothetical protein CBM2634_A240091 [Cupriavidus taiwanensis]
MQPVPRADQYRAPELELIARNFTFHPVWPCFDELLIWMAGSIDRHGTQAKMPVCCKQGDSSDRFNG